MRALAFVLSVATLLLVGSPQLPTGIPTQMVAANVHAVCPDSNTAFRGFVGGDTVRFGWAQHLQNTTSGRAIALPPIQWLSAPALAGMLDQQGRYVAKHPAWPIVVQARQGPIVILFCLHTYSKPY
jgi:hypothetical protein